MQFAVRYWSSVLAAEGYREPDGSARWLDYSLHPGTKLGLHNALLTVHDRNEILEAHGGEFDCAVFLIRGEQAEKLAAESAARLFAALPHGEVKWLDVWQCLLPPVPSAASAAPVPGEAKPPVGQLPLFMHTHTPYDDLDEKPHHLDIDV